MLSCKLISKLTCSVIFTAPSVTATRCRLQNQLFAVLLMSRSRTCTYAPDDATTQCCTDFCSCYRA